MDLHSRKIVGCNYTSIPVDLIIGSLQLHFDGLVQDCSNTIANTVELLQSCTKLSI